MEIFGILIVIYILLLSLFVYVLLPLLIIWAIVKIYKYSSRRKD